MSRQTNKIVDMSHCSTVSNISTLNETRKHSNPLLRHTYNGNDFGKIFVRTVVNIDPDSDLFMNIAQKAYKEHEKSLIPCVMCGRKFFPERIEQHQSSCNASKLNLSRKPPVSQSSTKPIVATKKKPEHSSKMDKPRWK